MQQKRRLLASRIEVQGSKKYTRICKRIVVKEEHQSCTALLFMCMGTNDLVSDDVNTSVKEMEEVIVEAKLHAHNVAISSVVKRYDNKVPNSRVAHFNNLVHDLCKKHKITFIDDNIDKSYLNRSTLHLNYNGDKALGKSLCSYLRSVKSGMSYTPDSHFICQSR